MDVLRDWWAIIMGAFAVAVWLVRIEGRTYSNSKNLEKFEQRMEKQRAEDMASRQREWDTVRETMKDMQQDIKTLLGRMHE